MQFPYLIPAFITFATCNLAQNGSVREPLLIGRCEGCEAILERNPDDLAPVDTLGHYEASNERLVLTGTVYQPNGRTPAEDVVVYAYHTDSTGIYPTSRASAGWEQRHGILRGWVKTGPTGEYAFYTSKPGSYPDGSEPSHIHLTVLEPDGKYYWISSVLFAGDPKLPSVTDSSDERGGPSIVELTEDSQHLNARRDIILGQNIPGYTR